eukprot:COSAG02_NODE_11614_length_1689_cov_1.713208_3_plen_82_part_00
MRDIDLFAFIDELKGLCWTTVPSVYTAIDVAVQQQVQSHTERPPDETDCGSATRQLHSRQAHVQSPLVASSVRQHLPQFHV